MVGDLLVKSNQDDDCLSVRSYLFPNTTQTTRTIMGMGRNKTVLNLPVICLSKLSSRNFWLYKIYLYPLHLHSATATFSDIFILSFVTETSVPRGTIHMWTDFSSSIGLKLATHIPFLCQEIMQIPRGNGANTYQSSLQSSNDLCVFQFPIRNMSTLIIMHFTSPAIFITRV